MPTDKCKIIELPKFSDSRGNLTVIEGGNHIPFDIKRVFYMYDVPGGAERGAHGHKKNREFVIALSGSFDVVLDDGVNQERFYLNRSYYGLYIAPMMWREITNISSGAVCMVLTSEYYDETDYYRDYKHFLAAVQSQNK